MIILHDFNLLEVILYQFVLDFTAVNSGVGSSILVLSLKKGTKFE